MNKTMMNGILVINAGDDFVYLLFSCGSMEDMSFCERDTIITPLLPLSTFGFLNSVKKHSP